MGDSDDEYDRRGRRDKFRGERNDYDNRRPPPRGYDRGRGDRSWNNDRGSKRDYYGGSKDRDNRRDNSFGRGSSPPPKRKREWESNGDQQWRSSGGQESNAIIPADKGGRNDNTSSYATRRAGGPGSPPSLMSFKDFIIQQEDDIDETEAVRRYQEYKVEFKRTQINDFFVLHKGEEWFEEKYHPIKSLGRKSFIRNGTRKRLRVFLDLWEAGYMDNLSLQISNNDVILKLLDRVIIKMEGGSEEDIKALDFPPKAIVKNKTDEEMETEAETISTGEEEKKTESKVEDEEKPKNYTYDADGGEDEENEKETKEPLPPGMDEDDEDLKPPGMEEDEEEKEIDGEENESKEEVKKEVETPTEPKAYVYDGNWNKRPVSIFIRSLANNVTRADLINVCKRYPGFMRVAMSDAAAERRYSRRGWVTFSYDTNIKDVCWNLSNIRVKDMELSPAMNRDVTNRVRPINGIACSPMAMQLDINFAVQLMKKLDSRIALYEVEETTNGHVNEEKEKEDIENEEKEKEIDGEDDGEDGEAKEPKEEGSEEAVAIIVPEKEIIDVPDSNPLSDKLPDYIEDVITGLELGDEEDDKKDYPIVVNEELRQWLDLVLLYLRVVHCVDFYNSNEYNYEDEMPMRCGIMHVRAQPLEAACKKDVHEYFESNTSKLDSIITEIEEATDDDADRLGKKDEEKEIENFIKANTQELAKDKWLCPLSGKKFRGPEFVRKHILMKHNSNVDNVKSEVKYFNNYIYDLKRPCFPEAKPKTGESTTATQRTGASASTPASWSSRQPVVFATPKSNYTPAAYQTSTPQPASIPQDTYGRMNTFPPKQMRRGGGAYRDRKVIKYRDLDAPEESDFF